MTGGRLDPPDITLLYATPAQMILFINGLQWTGYKKLEWGCVGESSCADSGASPGQGRAQPVHSLLCGTALRRCYGGRAAHGHSPALPPRGARWPGLAVRNGLRYPIAPYGVNNDARAGMGVSYG